MSALLAVCLTRLRRCRLQTLLLFMFCACDEQVDPTLLRFFVYSDVALARVRASVLDSDERELMDGGVFRDFYPDGGAAPDNLLFSIALEHAASSRNDQAVLRFEGYAQTSADSPIVLRQTVRADFTDRQTRLVRIWLSRACVHDTPEPCQELSCDWSSGRCVPTPLVASESYDEREPLSRWQPDGYRSCGERNDAGVDDDVCPVFCGPTDDIDCMPRAAKQTCTRDDQCMAGICDCAEDDCTQMRCCTPPCRRQCDADLQRDSKNCGACGLACEYALCRAGSCAATSIVPTLAQEPVSGTSSYMAVYMRRLIGASNGIAGVGINSDQVGAQFQLFVASDEAGEPTKILARGDVAVAVPATRTEAGRPRGTELVFAEPVRIVEGAPFWVGFVASVGATVETASRVGSVEERLASRLPQLGESFTPGDLGAGQPTLSATPSLYAIIFDP